MAKDYYSILGVSKSASQDDIKRAFRKLAHEHHPDKGGDAEKFKEINEAYQVLGDQEKRARYDQFGSADGQQFGDFGGGQGFPGGFSFDFSQFGDGAGFDDLGDILGSMFGMGGGGGRRSRKMRGADLQTRITISFLEAVFGVTKELTLEHTGSCARCAGTGGEPGTKIKTCDTCKGQGFVTKVQHTMVGAMQVRATCDTCDGRGEVPEAKCTQCRGAGTQRVKETVTLDIPAGIDDGAQLRVRGSGESIGVRGEPGDLFVTVRVVADNRFERDNFDIRSAVRIGFTQAALGGTLRVATVDGETDLSIPAGTQSGTELRLRGKGIPHGRGRGDHIVTVHVVTPTRLSARQRAILEEGGFTGE